MNYLVVIDTNVLISALLSKHSDAATVQVLNAVFDGTIIPVFNDEILAEYDNVLHRPKFKFQDVTIRLLLDVMKTYIYHQITFILMKREQDIFLSNKPLIARKNILFVSS